MSRRLPCLALFLLVIAGLSQAESLVFQSSNRPTLEDSRLGNLKWRSIGPAATSGRIADLAVVEDDPDIVYAATATGGVWKTINRGTTWEPVFDKGNTASIGAVAVAPSNPNVVWIGSGEAWSWRSSSWGDGVYKSEDGGKTWDHKGLRETRHIGRVIIHPEDPNTVYVAALGALWGSNEERGLFKTTDGGEHWQKVLYISPRTGVVDVSIDLRQPDRLYASAFQRARRNWSFLGGGPEGGIYKTEDGGASWKKLDNGLPKRDVGRIGISVCRAQPDTVYAAFVATPEEAGIYRSDDRGASWERGDPSSVGKIRCDPTNPERIYVLQNGNTVSEDGGKTLSWNYAGRGVHVDQHAMWINPRDSNHLVIGNDGGVYFTYDRGKNWRFVTNLPVTQFYTVAVDMQEPFYNVYGGTQDNYTLGGPSGTRYRDGIANEDWYVTSGGDGFHVKIDPGDPTIVYSESQYGRLVRFDTRTGERRQIQPAHPRDGKYRWNWSSPVLISQHDHKTLYFAANVVFRSPDRGDSWEVISPDLSRQISHFDLPLQGEVQPPDALMLHRATSDYGNITTLAESRFHPGLLAAGTDDGLIHVRRDNRAQWSRIELTGVPEKTRVSRIIWSSHRESVLYATFDAHKDNSFLPYVFRSDDFGGTWKSIASGLPEFGSTRVIVEHPRNPNLLFVGTEFGVFVSLNGGGKWLSLKNNMPTVPVHDIVIHPRKNDLVIGTHGRGFFILDDITILEQLTPQLLESDSTVLLANPGTGVQLHDFDRGRNFLGHTHYFAPNPPRGSVLSYYLSPSLLASSKVDEEDSRAAGVVKLSITDSRGALIRTIQAEQGSKGGGLQRVVWDLRHPKPFKPDPEAQTAFLRNAPIGPFVLPGEYSVRLQIGDREQIRKVQVQGDPQFEISDQDRKIWHDTLRALGGMLAALKASLTTLDQVQADLKDVGQNLEDLPQVPGSLEEKIQALEERLKGLHKTLLGDSNQGRAEQPGAPPLADRVRRLYTAIEASTALPTREQLQLARVSHNEVADLIKTVNQLTQHELPEIGRQLDELRIPWTPGRAIPTPSRVLVPG